MSKYLPDGVSGKQIDVPIDVQYLSIVPSLANALHSCADTTAAMVVPIE